MTNKRFCELYNGYCGGEIDNPKQLTIHNWSGNELKEYMEYLLESPKLEGVEKDLHYAKLDIEAKDERIAELESSLKLMNSIYNEDLAIKKELKKENERLRGLVENAFDSFNYLRKGKSFDIEWEQFKANNNL